jgi:juvenile hormone acid methyltransferase
VLSEFSHYFKWRFDGLDNLLDIGTGTGDVLVDFILPKMPRNFHKIVGVDVSNEMLECARENFGSEFIEFHQLDISAISACRYLDNQQFDNITSFYCLHWIQNQK